MKIPLTETAQQRVQALVASGRYANAAKVIDAALARLISEERLRQEIQIELDQANRGELREHEEVFEQLCRRIMRS